MLGPLAARGDRAGVPSLVTAMVLWLLVILVCNGVIMLLSAPVKGYAGCCAANRDIDQRLTAPHITAPTLVIAGARDPATPPEEGRWLAAAIPGAGYVELDAAHLSNVEQPDDFTRALLGFLG